MSYKCVPNQSYNQKMSCCIPVWWTFSKGPQHEQSCKQHGSAPYNLHPRQKWDVSDQCIGNVCKTVCSNLVLMANEWWAPLSRHNFFNNFLHVQGSQMVHGGIWYILYIYCINTLKKVHNFYMSYWVGAAPCSLQPQCCLPNCGVGNSDHRQMIHLSLLQLWTTPESLLELWKDLQLDHSIHLWPFASPERKITLFNTNHIITQLESSTVPQIYVACNIVKSRH